MAGTEKLPSPATPTFLAGELAEIRRHLAVLERHSQWLESEVAAIRAEQEPNVRPLHPGDDP